MAYVNSLSGSKLRAQLGSTLNESASAPTSSFAKKQLEKMGWSQGDGLGKNRQGRSTHIRIKKRTDEVGLGHSIHGSGISPSSSQWWQESIGGTLAKLTSASSSSSSSATAKRGKESKKKKRKRKSRDENEQQQQQPEHGGEEESGSAQRIASSSPHGSLSRNYTVPTDEDLFRATGGARFGMRAQRRALGKFSRSEASLTTEDEEAAKARIEWNGTGEAKVFWSNGERGGEKRSSILSPRPTTTPSATYDTNPPGKNPRKSEISNNKMGTRSVDSDATVVDHQELTKVSGGGGGGGGGEDCGDDVAVKKRKKNDEDEPQKLDACEGNKKNMGMGREDKTNRKEKKKRRKEKKRNRKQ